MTRGRLLTAALVVASISTLAGCGHTRLKRYPEPESFRNFLTLTVGKPAPDFQLRDIDGNTWRLADQKGKVVVMQFASSTSPGFVQDLDDFQREVLTRYLLKPDVVFVYAFTTEAHPELLSHRERRQIDRDRRQHMLNAAGRYYYTLKFKDHGSFHVSGLIPAAENVVLLVDTVDGSVGATYGYGRGGVTNPAFVINKDGTLIAKALKTSDFLSPSSFLAGNLPLMIQAQLE